MVYWLCVGLAADILLADKRQSKLFPLDLELTCEDLVKWLEQRVIPKIRAYTDEILKTLNLSVGNSKGKENGTISTMCCYASSRPNYIIQGT